MSVAEKGLISIGRFLAGIDNMSEEIDLEKDQFGKVIALAVADNVDITADGVVKRRKGQISVDDAMYHSLYCFEFPFGLCVTGGALHQLNEDGTINQLVTGLSMFDELTYAELSDRIFWSNGTINGMVMRDGTTRNLGVEVPTTPPMSVLPGTGEAWAGKCQIVITYRDVYGERSGTDEPIELTLTAGASVQLSAIPQPPDSDTTIEVFMTPPGGGMFYRVASFPAGITDYIVNPSIGGGIELDSLLLEPVPPATIYRMHNGRLLFADGRMLGWSSAMRPTICDLAHDFQMFGGEITMVEPISQSEGTGVYVAAGKRTFWLSGGDPRAQGGWALREVSGYGVVKGSSLLVPAKAFDEDAPGRYAYWLDTGGHFCIGKPGGVVQRIGERRFNAGVPESAASVFREGDGMRHVLTAMQGETNDSFRVQDTLGVKLVRRGGS
jgi:hypothetical protein